MKTRLTNVSRLHRLCLAEQIDIDFWCNKWGDCDTQFFEPKEALRLAIKYHHLQLLDEWLLSEKSHADFLYDKVQKLERIMRGAAK